MQSFTNKEILSDSAYRNSTALSARKDIYRYAYPRYDANQETIRGLALRGDEAVLDVGCGDGKLLSYLRHNNHRGQLSGIDISLGILSETRQLAKRGNLRLNLVVADAAHIPFADNSFDIVTSCHMIYHVPDIDAALSEMARVLKPDGTFALSANSRLSKTQVLKPLIKDVAREFQLESFPDATEWFSIESGEERLSRHFKDIRRVLYKSIISTTSTEPYIRYFDSLRAFWNKKFSDDQWHTIMNFVTSQLNQTLNEKGVLEEPNIFGIFYATPVKIYE